KSLKYIFITSQSTLSSEYQYLDASQPKDDFRIFYPREAKHEYDVDHYEDQFYIQSNWQALNFRLLTCPLNNTHKDHWQELIPHREDVLLEGIEIFKHHLVLQERIKGLNQLRIIRWDNQEEHYLDFGEATYSAYVGTNMEFDTPILRFGYTSLTSPSATYDYHMESREKTLLKQQEVLGDFKADNYTSERLYAKAPDGVMVPISLVYKKGLEKNGTNPLLLYGYGSYGVTLDPYFSSVRLSLLDRGFVFAIAHIRGGEEMGRSWYENGKMFQKKNTFTDFIACAEHLIQQHFTQPNYLFAEGGSAGGLLMGAVMNMRPDLFKGLIAAVPFVDVVTTMLDDSIPLTTGEYDEWGNPNIKAQYEYILSYSPYDQVESKDYPHLLVTTGLHDSQVQYWEPAKWVAKLRELKTDEHLLLLKTDMEAGHGGKTGRFKKYKDTAFEFAFLLKLLEQGT
ncbi:MAG: S9 family peptidase, partial [Bacteroidota bacterium]